MFIYLLHNYLRSIYNPYSLYYPNRNQYTRPTHINKKDKHSKNTNNKPLEIKLCTMDNTHPEIKDPVIAATLKDIPDLSTEIMDNKTEETINPDHSPTP